MARLFACIISADIKRDKTSLTAVAKEFSYLIETLDDGILFDVSGLERLVGDRDSVSEKIVDGLRRHNVAGSIAVAETIDSACLLARQYGGSVYEVHSSDGFSKLPLSDLPIEQDELNVFTDLGVQKIEDLLSIPNDDLITRYGKDFRNIIDVIEQKSSSMLVQNLNEHRVHWNYDLDLPVNDFEQLIFLLNHGFEKLFVAIRNIGLSTEYLDIAFILKSQSPKHYEIKTSFPTLERAFWLKLVNLRVSLDPPEAEIIGVSVTAHFTRPRPTQHGLYAVSRPEPENLLLTVHKLKKLVGEYNVGQPVILNRRLAEPFALDPDLLPSGIENIQPEPHLPTLAFTYYRPPQQVEVVYRDGRLVFIRTRHFDGHVSEYSGVWKGSSGWWDKPWKTQEWDVEIENRGIYRLCKANKEWFLLGEYD
jgi:protein ImuB